MMMQGTRRRLLGSLAGLLLVLGGAVVAPAPAMAAPGEHLRMSASGYARFGHPIYLAITWSVSGREVDGVVNLQRKTDGVWRHVRGVQVSNGAAVTRITPGGTSEWRLRASTTTTGGVTTLHPDGTSNTVLIQSINDVNKSAAPQLAAVRGSAAEGQATFDVRWLRGSTAVSGKVNLQRRSGSGWIHVQQFMVSGGTARLAVPASSAADYRLRASAITTPSGIVTAHPYGTSGTVSIAGPKPTVPSSFDVTGAGWGHGVGMAQYGARALAADGRSSTQILEHYYTGTSVVTRDMSRAVRIQVLEGVTSTQVRPSGGPARVRLGGSIVATVPAGTTFTVEAVSQGLRVRVGDQSWTTASTANEVHVEWAATRYYQPDRTVDVTVSVTGAKGLYRHGRLELRSIGGRVNAVNVLRLNDEYVYGVAEMPSSWPAHALRTQAVATRSYAYANSSSVRYACDCHLYDDSRSQNFTGWRKENETTYGVRWVAAVDATRSSATQGQVVTYEGSVIPAYYFSSSGGRTQNSEDVWTSALPWARSVSDPGSLSSTNPHASWRVSLTQAAVRSAFGLPDVVHVDIDSRTVGGGVRAVTASSSTGATATITGEQLRARLGLRSTWISSFE